MPTDYEGGVSVRAAFRGAQAASPVADSDLAGIRCAVLGEGLFALSEPGGLDSALEVAWCDEAAARSLGKDLGCAPALLNREIAAREAGPRPLSAGEMVLQRALIEEQDARSLGHLNVVGAAIINVASARRAYMREDPGAPGRSAEGAVRSDDALLDPKMIEEVQRWQAVWPTLIGAKVTAQSALTKAMAAKAPELAAAEIAFFAKCDLFEIAKRSALGKLPADLAVAGRHREVARLFGNLLRIDPARFEPKLPQRAPQLVRPAPERPGRAIGEARASAVGAGGDDFLSWLDERMRQAARTSPPGDTSQSDLLLAVRTAIQEGIADACHAGTFDSDGWRGGLDGAGRVPIRRDAWAKGNWRPVSQGRIEFGERGGTCTPLRDVRIYRADGARTANEPIAPPAATASAPSASTEGPALFVSTKGDPTVSGSKKKVWEAAKRLGPPGSERGNRQKYASQIADQTGVGIETVRNYVTKKGASGLAFYIDGLRRRGVAEASQREGQKGQNPI